MPTERQVVVLFTDICGYTGTVATRGTTGAVDLLRKHHENMKPTLNQYSGVYVKSTGDGLIAYFEDPKFAVGAAAAIQQRLAAYNMDRKEDDEIHVRIGLELGAAIVEEGEILGHCVNYAARLVGICHPDQIVIGKQLHEKVRRIKNVSFKKNRASFKGIPGPQEFFEVLWESADFDQLEKSTRLPAPQSRLNETRFPSDCRSWQSRGIRSLLALFASKHY